MYEFNPADLESLRAIIGTDTREHGKELQWKLCPYCNGGEHGDKWTFAVNMETGKFLCQRYSCGEKGAFVRLARDFGLELASNDYQQYTEFPDNILYRFDTWEATDEAKSYLLGRGIPEEITELYKVTSSADEDKIIFPFFDESKKLQTIKYRITRRDPDKKRPKEFPEKNTKPILYGMWLCGDSGSLVVTEGQIDALSLAAAGIRNVVSVPMGANNFKWADLCREFVERFDEIIVFGDCEHGKITLVDGICKAFPSMKVRKVRFQDYMHCKDANEILQTLQDEGDYDPAFQALRECVQNAVDARVLPVKPLDAIDWYYSDDEPVIKTGIRGLDKEIRGLSYGQLVILTGYSGDGKSNFASQLVANIADQDIRCLIYSGELSNKLVKEQISFIVAGSNRIAYDMQNAAEDGRAIKRLRDEEQTREALTKWMRDRVFIWEDAPIMADSTDKNETAFFLQTLEAVIQTYQIRFVLLDNLMTLMTVSEDSDVYHAQTWTIKKLKTLAQQLDVVILLVAHPRKSPTSKRELTQDSISGSKDIVNLADLVLAYTRHNDGSKENFPRRLNLLKNRRSGTLLEDKAGVYLGYDQDSGRIADNKDYWKKDYLKDFAPAMEPDIDF